MIRRNLITGARLKDCDACEKAVSPEKRADWIKDGEKYSMVGLGVKTEGTIPNGELVPGCGPSERSKLPGFATPTP